MTNLEIKKNIKEKTVKTKAKKSADKATPIVKPSRVTEGFVNCSAVLRPRITEKSGITSQQLNAYTFEVRASTSKKEVSKAIKELYKVIPVKINVINLPRKSKFVKGKKGFSPSVRKAIVYLKKDDKIEFI